MGELELLTVSIDPASTSFRELLDEFEEHYHVTVNWRTMRWRHSWAEISRILHQKSGPDITEVGSTWVYSLHAMRATRPFPYSVVSSLGGESAFVPASWKMCEEGGENVLQSVPLLVDTRVIYYRRDLFEQAGIDEQAAFQSPDYMLDTLARLKSGHTEVPLAMSTASDMVSVHVMASWVWGAGAEFLSPDGRQTAFTSTNGLLGMHDYFRMHPYLVPALQDKSVPDTMEAFLSGKAAVALAGPWIVKDFNLKNAEDIVLQNLGVARMPGVSFVGGSDLVIWEHSSYAAEAVELAVFLSACMSKGRYDLETSSLPARLDMMEMPPYDQQHFQVIRESIAAGRAFRTTPLWRRMEEELSAAINQTWLQLFADPDLDLEDLVADNFGRLAYRLDRVLY